MMIEGKKIFLKLNVIVSILTAMSLQSFASDKYEHKKEEHTKGEHSTHHSESLGEKELAIVAAAISKQKSQVVNLAERSKSAHDNTRLTRWLKKVSEGKINNPEKGFVAYKEGVKKLEVAGYIESTLQKPDTIFIHEGKIVVKKTISDGGFRHVYKDSVKSISTFEIEIDLKSVTDELENTGLSEYIGDKAQLIHAYPND